MGVWLTWRMALLDSIRVLTACTLSGLCRASRIAATSTGTCSNTWRHWEDNSCWEGWFLLKCAAASLALPNWVAAEHTCLAAESSLCICFFFSAFCAAALVADRRSSAADLSDCCCRESLGLPAQPYKIYIIILCWTLLAPEQIFKVTPIRVFSTLFESTFGEQKNISNLTFQPAGSPHLFCVPMPTFQPVGSQIPCTKVNVPASSFTYSMYKR